MTNMTMDAKETCRIHLSELIDACNFALDMLNPPHPASLTVAMRFSLESILPEEKYNDIVQRVKDAITDVRQVYRHDFERLRKDSYKTIE